MDEEEPGSVAVCVVRNPIEVAHAFHMQMVYFGFEPLTEFGEAWSARESRQEHPPTSCPVPRLLQYADIAALGRQVQRVIDRLGVERTHVVLYDDVLDDMTSVLDDLGARLELSSAPEDTGRVNPAMVLRSPRLARALRSSRGRRAARIAKSKLPAGLTRTLLSSKDHLLKRTRVRTPIAPALREELAEVFAPEVHHLEAILQRDLGHWLKAPQPECAS
jgi:hypothetical protein